MAFKLAVGQYAVAWRRYPSFALATLKARKGRHVIVTGPFRCGTSWVGDMLAGEGVWQLHEPFNVNKGIWPKNYQYQRASESNPEIDMYMTRLLAGQVVAGPGGEVLKGQPVNRPFMPLRCGIAPRPRRVVIKDPMVSLMSEYLVDRFDLQAVVMVRHPAGFAGSLRSLQWEVRSDLRQLLEDEKLMADWLAPLVPRLERAMGLDSDHRIMAFYAALVTVLHGFTLRNPKMELCCYETMCDAPLDEFRSLHFRLGLDYDQATRQRHRRMTEATEDVLVNRPYQTLRNTRKTANQWKARLTRRQVSDIRTAWEWFDVPLYREESDWSTKLDQS